MHILKQSELDGMPCPDTLIHGECIESMKHIADGSVDAIIADLPFGTTACKWDTVIPFTPLWEAYKRVIKPGRAIVLFGSQPFTSALVMSNLKWFKYCWVWDKVRPSNPMLAKVQPMKVHEDICVFSNGRHGYYPRDLKSTDKPRGGTAPSKTELSYGQNAGPVYKQSMFGYPKSIIRQGTDNSKNLHPTQKPSALLEMLVKTYTNPGDLVLDNVMGSGTLPVACLNTGRHFIGIEKDDTYFAASVERVKAALAQQAFAFDAPPSA